MPASFLSKTLYVCDCGPKCPCGYSAAVASNCGCGKPAVARRVLAEDIDYFYVSQTGDDGKAYDYLGELPFTSPDGKPLQRFPKDCYITAPAQTLTDMKNRAKEKLGSFSEKLSPNYLAEDVPEEHAHGANTSVRKATHKGREIMIKTTYEVTIDGKPFENHLSVDDKGRVHCHGLPNYAYSSMIDLIKRLIDADLELAADLPSQSETDLSETPNLNPHITHPGGHA